MTRYETGEYGWTTDLETVKRQVDWQLKELKTNYIDYGFIHCLDASSDWRDYQENGILAYLQEMKKNGVVRHIGCPPILRRLPHKCWIRGSRTS